MRDHGACEVVYDDVAVDFGINAGEVAKNMREYIHNECPINASFGSIQTARLVVICYGQLSYLPDTTSVCLL